MGYGDYPHMPDEPVEWRDKDYPYDYPEFRRNYMEPVHAELDFYDETRYGPPRDMRFSLSQMFALFMAVMCGSAFVFWWFEDKKMFRPVLIKQLPAPGQTHYTFDPKS